jgi:hypothetical protein
MRPYFYNVHRGILDVPVMEKEFLTQLEILNHKINFVKEQSFKGVVTQCIVSVSYILISFLCLKLMLVLAAV